MGKAKKGLDRGTGELISEDKISKYFSLVPKKDRDFGDTLRKRRVTIISTRTRALLLSPYWPGCCVSMLLRTANSIDNRLSAVTSGDSDREKKTHFFLRYLPF